MRRSSARGRDFLNENKSEAVEWAKNRRAQAEVAAAKRRERKLREESALHAQEEYERQIEQYKTSGSGGGDGGGGNVGSPSVIASWDAHSRPSDSTVKSRQAIQMDGPFGRSWNDEFASSSTSGWQPLATNLLDEEPPELPRRQQGRHLQQGDKAARVVKGTADTVLRRKAADKLAEQQRHESALEHARVQAAAERRLAADRLRRQRESEDFTPNAQDIAPYREGPSRDSKPRRTRMPPPLLQSAPVCPPPLHMQPSLVDTPSDTALFNADPNSLGWEAFQQLMQQEENVVKDAALPQPLPEAPRQRPVGPPGCAPPLWGRSPAGVAQERFGDLPQGQEQACLGGGRWWVVPTACACKAQQGEEGCRKSKANHNAAQRQNSGRNQDGGQAGAAFEARWADLAEGGSRCRQRRQGHRPQ
eukprot:COSAG05_NODE_203_length_14207_cov_24.645379_1_plen_418_part_00